MGFRSFRRGPHVTLQSFATSITKERAYLVCCSGEEQSDEEQSCYLFVERFTSFLLLSSPGPWAFCALSPIQTRVLSFHLFCLSVAVHVCVSAPIHELILGIGK